MDNGTRKRIAAALLTFIMAFTPALSGVSVSARISPGQNLNWNLTLTADKTLTSVGEKVAFTAEFDLTTGVIAGYESTRITIFLPEGLVYENCVVYMDRTPSMVTTMPAHTQFGTSVVIDWANTSLAPGNVQVIVETKVSNDWDGGALIVRAGIYLKPFNADMANIANEEAVVSITAVAPATPEVPPSVPVAPHIYVVRFNPAGGVRVGGGALVQAVAAGYSAFEPFVYREGFYFMGWNAPFHEVTCDMIITALWAARPDIGEITVSPPDVLVDSRFLNGNNAFTHFSHLPLIYVVDRHASELYRVEVENQILTPGTHYVATSGPTTDTTAIHLKASYLNTLAVGTYSIRADYADKVYANSQLTVENYVNRFYDVVVNDWFYEGVEAMNASGLLAGVGANQFSPYEQMTRAMVVALLYRYAGEPEVGGFINPFPDIAGRQWYTDAVVWAAVNGIVAGFPDGMFYPNDAMTREQFSAVLYRYQHVLGTTPMDVLMDRAYSDFDAVNSYAKNAVTKLTMQGVFRDLPPDAQNHFNPKAAVSRAEVSSVMRRWIESVGW